MSKLVVGTEEVLKVMMGTEEITSLFMGGEDVSPSSGSPEPQPVDYSTMPFTIEALESGNFTINTAGFDYSLDGGDNWVTIGNKTTLNLNEGDTIQIKRNSFSAALNLLTGNTAITFNVYGNIMSLIYGDNYIGQTSFNGISNVFYGLFASSNVVDASNLVLPPAIGAGNAYREMFKNAAYLTSAPELPSTTLYSACYREMFNGCSNLSYIKCLATDISAANCLLDWVKDVSATGTFVKDANTTWPSGNSGIPTGWTIVDA